MNLCPHLLFVSSCTVLALLPRETWGIHRDVSGTGHHCPFSLKSLFSQMERGQGPFTSWLSCPVCRTPQLTHLQLYLCLPQFRASPCAPHWALCCSLKMLTSALPFNNYHQVLRKWEKYPKQTSWPKGNKKSIRRCWKKPLHTWFFMCVRACLALFSFLFELCKSVETK